LALCICLVDTEHPAARKAIALLAFLRAHTAQLPRRRTKSDKLSSNKLVQSTPHCRRELAVDTVLPCSAKQKLELKELMGALERNSNALPNSRSSRRNSFIRHSPSVAD